MTDIQVEAESWLVLQELRKGGEVCPSGVNQLDAIRNLNTLGLAYRSSARGYSLTQAGEVLIALGRVHRKTSLT